MDTLTLSSTFFLTLLLLIGLFFFIRASVKDRTQTAQFLSETSQEFLWTQLQQHFTQRAYAIETVDPEQRQMELSGQVRPSFFLALFLSGLAAIGLLCLAFVLGFLFPAATVLFYGLLLLSPLAGIFYWKGAERPEAVALKVESLEGNNSDEYPTSAKSLLTLVAHRDEILALRRSLALKEWEAESN